MDGSLVFWQFSAELALNWETGTAKNESIQWTHSFLSNVQIIVHWLQMNVHMSYFTPKKN